jgi:hypothetical protein
MTAYDPIEFQFQVANDATVTETAYLVPYGLPWGATLDVTPAQADIPPGTTAVFACRLTLDGTIIRPGLTNDQGFRLTAWRSAQDADEQWGSCFYFVRPRVRTRVEILGADWHEQNLSIRGQLSLDTDQPVVLAGQLPLQVRIRLETDGSPAWVVAGVQPSGIFTLRRHDFAGPTGARLRIQAWFDRTDLLASSRSKLVEIIHAVAPVIG